MHSHHHYGLNGRFVITLAMVLDRFGGRLDRVAGHAILPSCILMTLTAETLAGRRERPDQLPPTFRI